MRQLAIFSGAAILLMVASVALAVAQDAMVLRGNHPVDAVTAAQVGRADQNRVLDMSITFALRNRDQLAQLLSDLQDPTSPQFHNRLTPSEFNRRFGSVDADVNAVVDWLRAQGFTINSVNRKERTAIESVTEFSRHVRKYVQCPLVEDSVPFGIPGIYDGVAELWFDSAEKAVEAFNEPKYLEIVRADELKFVDQQKCISFVTEERQVI